MRVGTTVVTAGCAALMIALLAGCPNREVSRVDPGQQKESENLIPVELNRDVDILFVIDNSGSMSEEQASLTANFARFINVLQTIEGGLPNIHMGVISTDMGAGPFNIQGCSGNGDNGTLQSSPRGACTPPTGSFIIDTANPDGTRTTNYPANELAETFSCIARLGTMGCGFEQPLQAVRKALDGSNPANQGFLRENAFLAVIIITDEDDCSTENSNMFDTSQTSIDSELGPLSSYRCFEFGVRCEPDSRTQVAPRQNCEQRADSPYMFPVTSDDPNTQDFVDFMRSLKPQDPSLIITAGIIGNPTPVAVTTATNGNPELEPSCVSASGEAAPGVRLKTFFDQFPNRNTITTICNEDLTDALVQVADLLIEVIGNPCLSGDIKVDDNGDPICTVVDRTRPNTDSEVQTPIAHCANNDPGAGPTPCWYTQPNPEDCNKPEHVLGDEIQVERGGQSVPTNTSVEVRCELN